MRSPKGRSCFLSSVQVFPYASPEWEEVVRAVLELETHAWRAWWRTIGELRGSGAIYPIPPLVESPDDAVRLLMVDRCHVLAHRQRTALT